MAMEVNGGSGSYQRQATVSQEDDDEDVYDDDSDFEYLAIPGYEFSEDRYQTKAQASEDAVIAFSTIHGKPRPYQSDDRVCFIPTQRVDVEITDVERTEHKVLNPNLYTIRVRHANFEWTIKRRYKHFRSLHDQLVLFRAKLHLPVPTRRKIDPLGVAIHRMRRQSFKQRRESLPRFPRRPEIMVSEEDIPERKKQLATYLQRILRVPPLRNHHETLRFFEVSHLSFVNGLGAKYREGLIKKRSGGRSIVGCCGCCATCVQNLTAHYNKRWLVLKDTFIAYINPHQGTISDVLLMDGSFDIQRGFMNTGVHHGLQIVSLNRQLMLKGWTHRNSLEWNEAINNVAQTVASDFTTPNRYNSFAPMRPNGHAQWFVDGAGYMAAVADAMEGAKEEIFITDWWLSPEIYMKRPMTEGDHWRLDVILKRKADEGVKIFVMLFKEVEMALGINSFYTKQVLLKLHHNNIKVLRHPDRILLWSHHEKMVVIDQRIAFLGGIDLCYGRYDTPEHRLVDLGSVRAQQFIGYPHVGFLHQQLFSISSTSVLYMYLLNVPYNLNLRLTDLGSILTSPTMVTNLTPGQSGARFHMPEPLPDSPPGKTTPAYDRSVSSHSWPETDADRAKLGLPLQKKGDWPGGRAQTGPAAGGGAAAALHKKRLTTISEGSAHSLEDVVPSFVVEGLDNTETDTDGPVTTQQDGENTEHAPEASEVTPTSSSPLAASVPADSSPSDSKEERRDTDAPPHDRTPARQLSTESWYVNVAAVYTPTDEEEKSLPGSQVEGDVEPVVQNTSQELSTPPPVPAPAPAPAVEERATHKKAEKSVTLVTENNNVEEPDGPTAAAARTATSLSAGWKKIKAIKVLHKWQGGGGERVEGDASPGRQRRGKRPTNLVLTRQGRVNDDGEGVLGLPPGTVKPSTPKPRKKIAQKAHDIKERFRKKGSKSVDVAGDTEFEFNFYENLEDQAHPEGVLEDLGLEGSTKIWIGKDYVNFISKDFVQLDKPFTDFIDRTKTPRMPWHDIGAVVYGKPARDVARHFIQRWNFSKVEKRKTNLGYPLLVPKCYTKVTVPRKALASSIPCKVQVLRSSDGWSAGIAQTDDSIHNAYIDLIQNAQHYIYIENQFFISIMDHPQVENKIASALFHRITRAHKQGQVFRVYVVMPLLPAFEGELGTSRGGAIQAIQHWNYESICRGGKSLLERLAAEIPDPSEYITFHGLRSHGDLGGTLVTELVYVHSKLMIVDDRTVVIGSANINDRSLLGSRDSELAIVTEDTHMRQSRMNGEEYEVGWFASGLRQALFREHLGVSRTNPDVQMVDPVIDSFYHDVFLARAKRNTEIYEEVFKCVPSDEVSTFSELTEYQKLEGLAQTNPAAARKLLDDVRGHAVLFPLNFLSASKLQPSVMTKEGLAPVATWT